MVRLVTRGSSPFLTKLSRHFVQSRLHSALNSSCICLRIETIIKDNFTWHPAVSRTGQFSSSSLAGGKCSMTKEL